MCSGQYFRIQLPKALVHSCKNQVVRLIEIADVGVITPLSLVPDPSCWWRYRHPGPPGRGGSTSLLRNSDKVL